MGERGRAPALPVDRPRAPRRHRPSRARQRADAQGGRRGCPRRGPLRRRPVRALPTDAAPPLDASLFAAVAATSAGVLFWFSVPESFGLAGLGVAIALLVASAPHPSGPALVAACVASASCILTNGIVGALATFAHHPRPRQWLRAIAIGAAAFAALAALWLLQERGRDTPFFLSDRLFEYEEHLYPVSLDRTAQVLQGLLSHAVVAPEPQAGRPSFRRVPIATNGPAGAVATLAWLALLGLGTMRTVELARRGERPQLAATAIGSLALVVTMHLTLGREMFLYAMDVLPLLLTLAAASACLPRGRVWVRALVGLLLLTGTVNNVRQFQNAAAIAQKLAEERVGSSVSPHADSVEFSCSRCPERPPEPKAPVRARLRLRTGANPSPRSAGSRRGR